MNPAVAARFGTRRDGAIRGFGTERHVPPERVGRVMRLPGVLALLLALVAGCVVVDGVDYVSARDAAPRSSTAGSGSVDVPFLVTQERGGPPLEGAVVVAAFQGRGEEDVVLAARTDAEGRVLLRVPPERALVLSAWKAGWTEERGEVVPSAGALVTVPLYRESLELELAGRLGPAGASTRVLDGADFAWDPRPLTLGERPASTPDYLRRLVRVEATLAWTNSATGAGDLGIGAGASRERPDHVHDEGGDQFGPGPHRERVVVPFEAVYAAGWRDAARVFVGAGTGKAFAAPLGLEHVMTVKATFDGNLDLRHASGPATAALVALAAAALLLPREPKR